MIYFCADDYGLCNSVSENIRQCSKNGALNKVSVFPNIEKVDLSKIYYDGLRICLHLNLVEGKCMADAEEIKLIADENGNLKNRFGGLFKLWLLKGKRLEAQAYKEIKAQVLYWKSILPEGAGFCVDSHQHTHMIPAIFRALLKVLSEEGITTEYMRIPAEPVLPYLKTPSLYFTYKPVNIIKQWLLKFLWFINKGQAKKFKVPTAYFIGIMFSGKMDAERVKKILPKYERLAKKTDADIEVLFHPGYTTEIELDIREKNIVFEKFYLSQDRKTEFNSVMNIHKGSVH